MSARQDRQRILALLEAIAANLDAFANPAAPTPPQEAACPVCAHRQWQTIVTMGEDPYRQCAMCGHRERPKAPTRLKGGHGAARG